MRLLSMGKVAQLPTHRLGSDAVRRSTREPTRKSSVSHLCCAALRSHSRTCVATVGHGVGIQESFYGVPCPEGPSVTVVVEFAASATRRSLSPFDPLPGCARAPRPPPPGRPALTADARSRKHAGGQGDTPRVACSPH